MKTLQGHLIPMTKYLVLKVSYKKQEDKELLE